MYKVIVDEFRKTTCFIRSGHMNFRPFIVLHTLSTELFNIPIDMNHTWNVVHEGMDVRCNVAPLMAIVITQ